VLIYTSCFPRHSCPLEHFSRNNFLCTHLSQEYSSCLTDGLHCYLIHHSPVICIRYPSKRISRLSQLVAPVASTFVMYYCAIVDSLGTAIIVISVICRFSVVILSNERSLSCSLRLWSCTEKSGPVCTSALMSDGLLLGWVGGSWIKAIRTKDVQKASQFKVFVISQMKRTTAFWAEHQIHQCSTITSCSFVRVDR
jgi:hypothetical protein